LEIDVVTPLWIKSDKHLAMTIKCFELARQKTKLPYQHIIVETGSDYLKDYADVHIYEKEKVDICKSINRAFKCTSGQYIAQLANDVFVGEGWLESLLECFKIKDCGISTLASTQFNHKKEEKIEEGIWFALAMIPQWLFQKIGYFDEEYKRVWADTDFVLRTYKEGYKMYRNFNCVVEHTPGTTEYGGGHDEAYLTGRKLFNDKHKDCGLPIFEGLR